MFAALLVPPLPRHQRAARGSPKQWIERTSLDPAFAKESPQRSLKRDELFSLFVRDVVDLPPGGFQYLLARDEAICNKMCRLRVLAELASARDF